MFCRSCGKENADSSGSCEGCGRPLSAEAPQAMQYRAPMPGTIPDIPNYLGWAIAVLILCFWPTGIAAVVYAVKVNNKLALGDIAAAQEASRKAKMWCWVSFIVAVAALVIGILVAVAGRGF
jgi:hypothetical protein